jgi:hypothetical protein
MQRPLFRFPKVKDESWFVLAGSHGADVLAALKRTGNVSDRMSTLHLDLPVASLSGLTSVDVFIMSDTYAGLDQVIRVPVGNASCQQQGEAWHQGAANLG